MPFARQRPVTLAAPPGSLIIGSAPRISQSPDTRAATSGETGAAAAAGSGLCAAAR